MKMILPPKTVSAVNINNEPVDIAVESVVWRPAAHALIFNEAGELLVLDNLLNGKHDLPGGGIEIWENIEEALLREVWEETGLTVRISGLVHVEDAFFLSPSGKHWHTLKIFYQVEMIGGELRSTILADEISVNPHWMRIRNLSEDSFTAGTVIWRAIGKCLNV